MRSVRAISEAPFGALRSRNVPDASTAVRSEVGRQRGSAMGASPPYAAGVACFPPCPRDAVRFAGPPDGFGSRLPLCGERPLQGGQALALLGVRGRGRHGHFGSELEAEQRRHGDLVDVREEGSEAVEVARRVGIELVIVTLGTAERRAHPHRRGGARPVGGIPHGELLLLATVLAADLVQPVVAGGHALWDGRRGQEIPASCSMVKRSKGMFALKASITQSRYG